LANRALHPIVRHIETTAGFSRSLSAEARRAGIDALVAASPTLFAEDAGCLNDLLGIETETRPELDDAARARGASTACWRGGWRAWPATYRS
jgi:hypothetical protein